MTSPAKTDVVNSGANQLGTRTVEMTTGQYYFHRASEFLIGGSVRIIALQQAMQAGTRISEVALRLVEFTKAVTFGTRPMSIPNDGKVPEMLVNVGNRVLTHFNYRTFGSDSSAKLFRDSLPFAITAMVAWEVGSFCFGKPSPLYNIVSFLPINVRFDTVLGMVGQHGSLPKAAGAWVDRALGRNGYENGASSTKELQDEAVRKLGADKALPIIQALGAAERGRKDVDELRKSQQASEGKKTVGEVISSKWFNFLFGGSLRLVALQQTLQAALRISEVALRGIDAGKALLFGERALTISAESGMPTAFRNVANGMLAQYSFRSFTSEGALQLLKEAAPFALTAVAMWEFANYFFGAPSSLYNIVSVLPVNVRKDTLYDMIHRHGGVVPASKALLQRATGTGDFANNTRSLAEIKADLVNKFGADGAKAVIAAYDQALSEKKE